MSTAVFPSLLGLTWDVTRTPKWSTTVQTATSGKELRIANWTYPVYEWQLSFEMLRADSNQELQELIGFYNARQGSYDTFLYRDVADNQVSGQEIATGDGSTTSFQLLRTFGGFIEPVTAPNTVSNVYVSGTPVTGWSVNASTGVVTLASAPASGAPITADFTYYFRVRFSDDSNDFNNFMYQVWELKQIKFMSVK